MTVTYTNPALVDAVVTDLYPPRATSVTGYGDKLPTRYRIHYRGCWRRVYAMRYSNAASLYVRVLGNDEFIDTTTEYKLSDGIGTL